MKIYTNGSRWWYTNHHGKECNIPARRVIKKDLVRELGNGVQVWDGIIDGDMVPGKAFGPAAV